MTTPPAVTERITETTDELVGTVERLLGADTRNPPGETRGIAEWLREEFETLGYETETFCVDPSKPNVVATVPGSRDTTLVFNGHLDTVPFADSEWEYDPLGERDGDRIYGRGATDMKGAVGAMLQVARAYARTDTTPPVTVQFVLVSDEEVGGDAGLGTRLKTDKLDPDACVIGEATGRADVNSLAVGDRGYVWPTITVEGDAAHGSRPVFGTNAIDALYDVVSDCRRAVEGMDVPTEEFADDVMAGSVDFYATQIDRADAAELFESPTVNLGTITGGDAPNSVPATAEAELDVRVLPSQNPEAVVERIRSVMPPAATITDLSWTEGTYTDPNTPLVEAATAVATETLPTPVYRRFATGSGDAQAFRECGVPTIEFATGTGTVHGVDEYTTVQKLRQNALAYAKLPFALADRL
ncbi:MAG: M20 family metallopeptidase [Halobaculum sp.]